MTRKHVQATVAGLLLLASWGCGRMRTTPPQPAPVTLEVFIVTAGKDAIQYVKRTTTLSQRTANPDDVARTLTAGIATSAILHSTSWRWEKDGTIVLTYLAYSEDPQYDGVTPVQLRWDQLAPPPATDPQHPRPTVIREEDVIAHGLRHFSFLIRYARDGRLAASLSPQSLAFFNAMCGQLAGKLDAAQQFEECAALGR